ncbi:Radical SAM protein [Vibrio crassostreae]|nr:Radical SAM protein [Vibrio crassostreae]CAK2774217.1 Radical SAM protein [Vibrio crassostreae]CAK3217861.1 Radical SAM protein [Vibrio crassostreae]CAK3841611.1 Radical SAM protein [Vibrio crassostreae]
MSVSDFVTNSVSEQILGNDLVINEDACNLGCHYCLTGQSNMKAAHGKQLIFEPPIADEYGEDTELGKRLNMIVERVNAKLTPPLIKLTGGEVFLIKGIITFIEKMAKQHVSVIVQTNALPLNEEKIRRLASLENLTIQVSLDSNVYEGNSYRVNSEKLHDKLMGRIFSVINAGIPTEIYAVLNDRSTNYLKELVQWCGSFGGDNLPQLFPFPVRGPDSDKYKVQPEQYHLVDAFQDMLEEYSEVLPPKAYLERLSSFYHQGRRSWQCHLPRLVISTFSDGVSTPCPNIWFHNMGNLTDDSQWQTALAKVNNSGFYDLLLSSRPRLSACHGCFTPWDTLSLYFEDVISLEELCRAPSYASAAIRQLLVKKKSAMSERITVKHVDSL